MITRAVIPIAGRATRLRPWSAATPKALLPLVDADGRLRAVIHWILAEAAAGGITHAALVVSPGQRAALEAYLQAAAGDADLPRDIVCIEQSQPRGLGDAVLEAAEFAGDEPVCVLLGDHVRRAAGRSSCTAQVLAAMDAHAPDVMIGMQVIGPEALERCGVAAGEPLGDPAAGGVYRCTALIEKPDAATAQRELVTPGLGADRYLAHAGIYAFTPAIFDALRDLSAEGADGEIELTEAERRLCGRGEVLLCRVAGDVLDTGTPGAYADAFAAFARPTDGCPTGRPDV
ncbi:MAG: hypothetical protein KGY99_03355 [Phycisphaerae bacterium]|nr:hypothetical protein [Phycisphaerae bacterium]